MKRREFIECGAGLILLLSPIAAVSSIALGEKSPEQTITDLEETDIANSCQSIHSDQELSIAMQEVNPAGDEGLSARSIGCKSPHKHILFLPQRYLENPDLIEQETDIKLENGSRAKQFETSHAFDMSTLVKWTVGAHTHSVCLTKSDIEEILANDNGIKKIAYQNKLFGGGTEPGHVFHLRR